MSEKRRDGVYIGIYIMWYMRSTKIAKMEPLEIMTCTFKPLFLAKIVIIISTGRIYN
jgi:hypothetical protein